MQHETDSPLKSTGPGKLVDFVADRYYTSGDETTLETWSTPIKAYGEKEGLRVPIKGKGVWMLDSGDFTKTCRGSPRACPGEESAGFCPAVNRARFLYFYQNARSTFKLPVSFFKDHVLN
ncbi:hypothetical protein KGY79_08295 [Candidatus Bipolaricaulota bacterium]|nr:hypothetical protein [Candidatus Bipolaricaulota bacterium]